uniref:Uncharacterized protein n=1 Tax=Macrostomum lignano TaxID=282301 RepID=A0A1I8FJH1_9PLAT
MLTSSIRRSRLRLLKNVASSEQQAAANHCRGGVCKISQGKPPRLNRLRTRRMLKAVDDTPHQQSLLRIREAELQLLLLRCRCSCSLPSQCARQSGARNRKRAAAEAREQKPSLRFGVSTKPWLKAAEIRSASLTSWQAIGTSRRLARIAAETRINELESRLSETKLARSRTRDYRGGWSRSRLRICQADRSSTLAINCWLKAAALAKRSVELFGKANKF